MASRFVTVLRPGGDDVPARIREAADGLEVVLSRFDGDEHRLGDGGQRLGGGGQQLGGGGQQLGGGDQRIDDGQHRVDEGERRIEVVLP